MDFPFKPKDARKFERIKLDILVIIYILEKREDILNVLPYYVSKTEKAWHVDLLLIQNYYVDEDGEEHDDDDVLAEPLRFYYVWIKNMSALIGAQVSKRRHKKFLFKRSLHYFWSESKLAHHKIYCHLPAENA